MMTYYIDFNTSWP